MSTGGSANGAIVFLGRLFLALIFLISGPSNFTGGAIGYAASQGVPLASLAVPVSGILAIVGGLSILVGYRAKAGAWLLVAFLVPVTLMMHKFWTISDPAAAQAQMYNFLKNVAMLGGALVITQFGAGPWSMDARRGKG